MNAQTIEIMTEAETDTLGRRLALALPPGAVVSLVGTLGAGKTRLVRAVTSALGHRGEVTSPTFVLVNEYCGGRLPVYHFDAYRLKDTDEFLELGPEEYFDGEGITFVEWGDRVAECLPPDALEVRFEVLEGERRRVTLGGFRLDADQQQQQQ
ncbi:tRNA (adenosine(37)-N6)-threonylcarbamoyltransferase complex ATPase subunit type 1 TsaE [Pseudobythopirellula maris]|nr:tRNA (adenosine(37)-N6)-threonylcarbamoyltransferase complex ATPase subunit type 1 TsaE [Pseudobythopirellula maris]